MTTAPDTVKEADRLAALERYGLLDTPPDAAFDSITQAAADLCETPIALITLVDSTRQWFKSCVGMNVSETSRDVAFCSHAILSPTELLEVEDATLDERFLDNPLVTGEPNIRFYAGRPLVTPDGFALGTLCVIDRQPRRLSEPQRDALDSLANAILAIFEERRQYVGRQELAEARESALGAVLEASINEIFMFDETTLRFVHVNQGARENLGYTMDELRELTPVDIKPEFSLETFIAAIKPLRDGIRSKIDFLTVHERKDGSTYPVEVHLQRSEFDSTPVFVAIILDITERTQTEEALAQARLFLESAPDATIIINGSGKIEVANSQTVALLGYGHNELRGLPVETLVPKRYRDGHAAHREAYSANPTVREMGSDLDLYAVTKDDREFPIEVSLSPIQTGDGTLVAAAIRDITARKETQEALRESEERYRDLFENANDLIQSVAPDGSLFYVNPTWRRTLGYSEAEIAKLSMFDVIHADSQAHCQEIFGRVMAGETIDHLEAAFVTKTGELVYVEGSASCRMRDGKPVSTRAIFHDVTERKHHDDALRHAKDIAESATAGKSRFLAAASHDLRQPLQAIGMYLSVLGRLHDQPKQHEVGDKMLKSLDTMGELLDALLDISKLDGGSVVPEKRDIPLREIVDRIVTDNVQQAEEKGLQMDWSCDDCSVHTDPALLERVIENFVTNAIRYTEEGRIRLVGTRGDGIARIAVTDTGIGMPAESLDKVFDEYYQLDNDVRDRRKGLGLGLSIVKHIARLLDHPLDVSSVEGEGSTFTVEVPLGAPVSVKPEIQAAPARGDREPIVLFVDDDPAVVDATSMMLEAMGIVVHSALNGDDALAHLASGVRPDIVVSDYRLPGYNGIEVVRRVRAATSNDLPTVLMTGDTSAKEIESADLSNCTVLHKPVDTSRLINLIESLTA